MVACACSKESRMTDWYVKRGDKIIGPLGTDKLKGCVAEGKVLPTDQLAKDVAGPWTTAGNTKLFAERQAPEPPPTEWVTVISPERVAEATQKSSKGILIWAVGLATIVAALSVAAILTLPTGKPQSTSGESAVAGATLAGPAPLASKELKPREEQPTPPARKPFEYRIINEEWHNGFRGESVSVDVQVADDVGPTVTQADLESIAPVFMKKYEGAPFRIMFYTATPLANAWGVINYTPDNPSGKDVDCMIHDFAFELGPWYFPDKIDRDTDWHKRVWITLPMANKIVNGATQYHWKISSRTASDVYFDSRERPFGAMNDDMRLSPQTWEICTYDGDVPRFVRLVESSLNHLDYELSQNIVGKLNSVIGSQEYLNGDEMFWTWMLGKREVTYMHHSTGDTVTIMQVESD